MGDPGDMNFVVRVSASQFCQLEREAGCKGLKVGDYAAQLLAEKRPDRSAPQAPSCEDVRVMICEEIRAALSEGARVVSPHAHTFRAGFEPKRQPSGIDTLWALSLDFAAVACPASVADYHKSLKGRVDDPLLGEYMARQNDRQEAFYRDGGDLTEFRAEEWGEFVAARLPPEGVNHFGSAPKHT